MSIGIATKRAQISSAAATAILVAGLGLAGAAPANAASDPSPSGETTLPDGASPEQAESVDAASAEGQSISGTVTLPSGAPEEWLSLVEVYVYDEGSPGGDWTASAPVDPVDGSYSVTGLAAEDYVVEFRVNGYLDESYDEWTVPNLLDEYYGGGYSHDNARTVSLSDGSAEGIDGDLDFGLTIEGTVSLDPESGVTLADLGEHAVAVIASSVVQEGDLDYGDISEVSGVDPSTGKYLIDRLPPGDYVVEFVDDLDADPATRVVAEFYDNVESMFDATVLTLNGAGKTGIDAQLAVGGSISGTVSIAAGSDPGLLAQGIRVYAEPVDWGDDSTSGDALVDPITGAYTIEGLRPGMYVVYFDGESFWNDDDQVVTTNVQLTYYGGALREEDATPVDTRNGHATGIDAALTEGLTISGNVTVDAGVDPALLADHGAYVTATPMDSRYGTDASAVIDVETGNYRIEGLTPGTYTVNVEPDGYFDEETEAWVNPALVGEYYDDALNAEDATPVLVEANVSGIDFSLARGSVIRGTLTFPEGTDPAVLDAVYVNVEDETQARRYGGTVNQDGEFEVRGVANGSYLVSFGVYDTWDHATEQWISFDVAWQFYDNAFTRDTATPVVVDGADVNGIDATLLKYADARGNANVEVSWAGSEPPYSGPVCAGLSRTAGGYYFTTECGPLDKNQVLAFSDVLPGTYELSVHYADQDYPVAQYGGSNNVPGNGTLITVEVGETTEATVTLSPVGAISGSVTFADPATAADGEPTAVLVYAERSPGDWQLVMCPECHARPMQIPTQFTDLNGTFSVSGLVPGQYKVGFLSYADDGAYLAENPNVPGVFYGGKDLASASVVTVTANGETTGINAVLPLRDTSTPDPEPDPEPDPKPTPKPTPVNLVDVSSNKNSKNYTQFHTQIQWLANAGITKGWNVGGGKHEFRAKDEITREAMAAFMYRYAGSPAVKLPAKSPFSDVTPQNTNFYKEIVWLNQQGISTGWSVAGGNKEFRPKDNITRDAMAAFMYRFAGKPATTAPASSPFVDLPTSSQFYKEVTWLASTGISTGWKQASGKPQYRPYDEISREAMAAFLFRYNAL